MESATSPPPAGGRRVLIRAAGDYDRLEVVAFEPRAPKAGEVQIAVEAAGVNYADTIVRRGLYASAKELVGWPITPGFEVAGRVAVVGADVTSHAVGDAVFAVTLFDGYASHLTLAADQVFRMPPGLTMAQAAAFPAVLLTAWYALFELAHPRAGQTVLIHSAAGGAGGSMVQLAKIAGCRVVGVVGRSDKVAAARALGADEVIDKSTESLWKRAEQLAPQGYDVVLDANGVETLKESYEHLRRPGKLVVYGFASMMPRGGRTNWLKLMAGVVRTPRFHPLNMTQRSASVLAFNLSYLFEERHILSEGLAQLLGWMAEGKLQVPPVTEYPLDRVADAQRDLESGRTVGKLVLVP